MALAVLMVSGDRLDLDACLAWIPEDGIWRAGQRDGRGRIHATSGFIITLADNDDSRRALSEAMAAFEEFAIRVNRLVAAGAIAVIDFGLFVGPSLMQSIEFRAEDLNKMQAHGVGLTVTAYPCADDEDE